MKTKKIITGIVIGTLILSTGTAVIDKNNIVKAKESISYENYSHKIIKKVYISKEEFKKTFHNMYEQGIISEQEKNELDSILDDRGRGGWLHIDIFSDGAIDVHIPGWMVVVGGVISAGAIAAALSSIVPAAFVASAEQIVSLLYSKEISEVIEHGIVVYMTKTSNNLICAGGNCYYGDKFFFHHVRLDT